MVLTRAVSVSLGFTMIFCTRDNKQTHTVLNNKLLTYAWLLLSSCLVVGIKESFRAEILLGFKVMVLSDQ